MLEVLQYAVDEAADGTTRAMDVVLHDDGSVQVTDDGRGTDTRPDGDGVIRVKPVVATRDLRFFDVVDPPRLADGVPRRGLSVVAAVSARLDHDNVRADGAWSARYERGHPVRRPRPVDPTHGTGTTIRFWPDPEVPGLDSSGLDVVDLRRLVDDVETTARVTLRDERRR